MNLRPVITFSIGLVMASAAVFLISQRLDKEPEHQTPVAAEPPFPTASIVVASSDLKFGNRIGQEHLKTVMWPADSLPEGYFSTAQDLLGASEKDRVVLRPMSPGEPVLRSKVSGFGGRATMSTMIPEDKRAYAIKVDAVSGVAGFLLPGDHVDILLTRNAGSNRNNKVTDIILQKIMIRGIDQIADEDRNKPQVVRTVTVEVTPDEAQKLALAMQVGTLSLSLRNMQSAEKNQVKTIGISDLQGKPRKVGSVAPSVKVRRGSSLTVETVRN